MDPVRLGKYEIVREIARGSMGLVFQAKDTALGRTVALKVLREGDADDKFVKRLHNEARAAARLRHPNIIAIHDVGNDGPVHYFAMDYIEGTSLDRVIGTTPLPRLLEILRDVARAVDFAHRQHIVHRDLKPANILLDATGRPIVSDFGLAKTHDTATHLTKTGAAIGTPHYMAPEQVLGRHEEIDARTDVYALGVILYQMLTQRLPHGGTTTLDVFRSVMNEEPPAPDANPDLRTICMKAMEREKIHRYPSASAFADDVDRYLRGEPVAARPPSTMRRVRAGVNRHPTLAAAVTAALVALGVGGTFVWRERRAKQSESERATGLESAQKERERLERDAAPFYDSGKRAFEKARSLHDTLQGGRYEILSLLVGAARDLSQAVEIRHDYAEAHDYLGRTFALRHTFDDAPESFEKAELHFQRAIDLLPTLTSAYLERGRMHFRRYLARRGSPSLLVGRDGRSVIGPLAPETEDLKSVREAALKYLKKADPDWAEGAVAYALGNYETAIRRFGAAIERDAANPETWYLRGMARFFMGDLESAERDLTQAIRWMPRHFEAFANRGLCRFIRRRLDDALADYNEALTLHPDHPTTLVNRSLCYLAMEQLEKAERDCDRVLAVDPDDITCLLNRGQVLRRRGDFKGAERDFLRLTKVAPDYKAAWLNLGVLRSDQEDYAGAIGYYNRALALDPDYANALFNRGNAHRARKEYEKSVADLTRVTQLDPSDAVAFYNRGIAREEFSRESKDPVLADLALADYSRAIEIDKDYAGAYRNRGSIFYERSEWRKALADFERASQLSPDLRGQLEERIADLRRRVGGD